MNVACATTVQPAPAAGPLLVNAGSLVLFRGNPHETCPGRAREDAGTGARVPIWLQTTQPGALRVGSVPTRPTLLIAFYTRDRETAERLMAVVAVLLWAQLAAAGGRNDARLPWMRTSRPRGGLPSLRRARRSISGRRARG